MKIIRILLLFIFCNLLYGCPELDEMDYKYKLKNHSTENVYYYYKENLNYFPPYLNTSFILSPGEEFSIQTDFAYGKIYVWFFDVNIIENNPFSEVIENEMYLAKFELTLEDLEAMNWEVIYEGD